MPPPVFRPGSKMKVKTEVPAKIRHMGVWRGCELPPGRYGIKGNLRNEEFWHDQDNNDGYTYTIVALDRDSELYGREFRVLQNDLVDGVYPGDE